MTESYKANVYKLGNISFTVPPNQGPELEYLDALLPQGSHSDFITIPEGTVYDLRSLQNLILEKHRGLIWLDAGCLINKSDKKLLIVGMSGAGKSTTTMALAIGYRWKVIAEDILLIDTKTDRLITLGAPFSLKPGTLELLKKSIGAVPTPIFDDEWAPLGDLASYELNTAHFDYAVYFESKAIPPRPMCASEITVGSYFRQILSTSNILRLRDAPDKMLEYLNSAKCFSISGGSLKERLDYILEHCA